MMKDELSHIDKVEFCHAGTVGFRPTTGCYKGGGGVVPETTTRDTVGASRNRQHSLSCMICANTLTATIPLACFTFPELLLIGQQHVKNDRL